VLVHAACTPEGRHVEKYDFFRGVLALRSAAVRGGGGGGGGGDLPLRSTGRCVALHLGNLRGDLPPRTTPGLCSSSGHAAAQVHPDPKP